MIIFGIPASGKSYASEIMPDKIADIDWGGMWNSEFPDNYLSAVRKAIDSGKIVLTNSNDEVIEILKEIKTEKYILIPEWNCVLDFVERLQKRTIDQADDTRFSTWLKSRGTQKDTEYFENLFHKQREIARNRDFKTLFMFSGQTMLDLVMRI